MVMLFHYALFLNRHQPVQRVVASLSELGWTGVDLFFVLSGFLITGILLDTPGASLYYLGLPLTFFVVAPGGAHPLDRLWYLFSAQNWVKIDVFFAGHYWSLAVK